MYLFFDGLLVCLSQLASSYLVCFQFKEGKNTKYLFNWASPLVCPPRQLSCVLGDGEDEYDLGVLTKQTSSWEGKHNGDTYVKMNLYIYTAFTS